jgi:hypothetical protein
MKSGDKKAFVYMPMLGFIEAAETMEETIKRANSRSPSYTPVTLQTGLYRAI